MIPLAANRLRGALVLAGMVLTATSHASLITENFDVDPGWSSSGNSINGNSFGFSNTNLVTGSAGEAGGTFARSQSIAYYADTTLGGTLYRADSLTLNGSLRLVNSDFNGSILVGYFNTSDLLAPTQFIGIQFAEPSGLAGNPFRALATIRSSDNSTVQSSIINIPQSTTVTFNLEWDGSSTLSGTINGTPVSISQLGMHPNDPFDAFGIGTGFASTTISTLNTNGSYFDDVTYTAVPEPSCVVGLGLAAVALAGLRSRRRHNTC
jgi:MYXO-CTERM domain-containing protein